MMNFNESKTPNGRAHVPHLRSDVMDADTHFINDAAVAHETSALPNGITNGIGTLGPFVPMTDEVVWVDDNGPLLSPKNGGGAQLKIHNTIPFRPSMPANTLPPPKMIEMQRLGQQSLTPHCVGCHEEHSYTPSHFSHSGQLNAQAPTSTPLRFDISVFPRRPLFQTGNAERQGKCPEPEIVLIASTPEDNKHVRFVNYLGGTVGSFSSKAILSITPTGFNLFVIAAANWLTDISGHQVSFGGYVKCFCDTSSNECKIEIVERADGTTSAGDRILRIDAQAVPTYYMPGKRVSIKFIAQVVCYPNGGPTGSIGIGPTTLGWNGTSTHIHYHHLGQVTWECQEKCNRV